MTELRTGSMRQRQVKHLKFHGISCCCIIGLGMWDHGLLSVVAWQAWSGFGLSDSRSKGEHLLWGTGTWNCSGKGLRDCPVLAKSGPPGFEKILLLFTESMVWIRILCFLLCFSKHWMNKIYRVNTSYLLLLYQWFNESLSESQMVFGGFYCITV